MQWVALLLIGLLGIGLFFWFERTTPTIVTPEIEAQP